MIEANPRDELIDILTATIGHAMRKGQVSTENELQDIITSCMESFYVTDASDSSGDSDAQ